LLLLSQVAKGKSSDSKRLQNNKTDGNELIRSDVVI
jgi:hypothetical protein